MKKKMMPKILGIVMAVVLFAMAPLFLTACGASADLTAVVKAAAKDYYKNHVNYENFANTTYVYETNNVEKWQDEVEYKVNAEDEEFTTGKFDFSDTLNVVYKIQVVNVEEGKLALVIDITSTETKKEYDADENDLLKEIVDVSSRHTIYTYSYITEAENTTYYLTKSYEVRKGEEVVETNKFYRVYDDEDEYVDALEDIFEAIDDKMISNAYLEFTTGEILIFYSHMLDTEVSGKNAKVKLSYDTFYVNNAEIYDVEVCFEVGFENNKFGKVKMNSKSSNDNFTAEQSSNFHVEYSAENVDTVITYAGATERPYLSANDDIPRVEIGLM